MAQLQRQVEKKKLTAPIKKGGKQSEKGELDGILK
jgi:hypothetical protein